MPTGLLRGIYALATPETSSGGIADLTDNVAA